MTIPYQFLRHLNNRPCTKKKNQPATSPKNEPGSSCSNVGPDFPVRNVPRRIAQFELNYLIIDHNLSEIQGEVLASPLQEWNLLQQSVKVTCRKRQHSYSLFFSKNGELVY